MGLFEDTGLLQIILFLVLVVILVIIILPKVATFLQILPSAISSTGRIYFPQNSKAQSASLNSTVLYTLSLINKDRNAQGLPNVTLSTESSAQQHAVSMLQNNYFSHWDIYGMKPYMRYTLLGGKGAVVENIAYTKSGIEACIGTLCKSYGDLNVTNAIRTMEYNMINNDSICCNNGHRDNILDPRHTQVAIGIAYNSTTIYLTQDFINNYTSWLNNTPGISDGAVYLEGNITPGYKLSSIEIVYDNPLTPLSSQQLDQTSEYSYGQAVAGVVGNPLDYYPSLTTIIASAYRVKNNNFFVVFNTSKLISQYGPGEYTVELWLNGTSQNSSFVGSTYTIFVNQSDAVYSPSNV